MCVAIPSKIISISSDNSSAVVDTMGIKRDVSLDLLNDNIDVGDYVLLHVGFAISKIDTYEADETLKLFKEFKDKLKYE